MEKLLVPGKPSIKRPTDGNVLEKLFGKLFSYQNRMAKLCGGFRGDFFNTVYKAFILDSLLTALTKDEILQEELDQLLRKSMILTPEEHEGPFERAWQVIWGYVHDPLHFPLPD